MLKLKLTEVFSIAKIMSHQIWQLVLVNLALWEAETGVSQCQTQPRLRSVTLF